MSSLTPKIKKLQKALELRGNIYLFTKTQVYSKKLSRLCTLNKLDYLMPVEDYNKLHPEKPKDVKRYQFVKVEVIDSFRELDILLCLLDVYKKAGDDSG